MDREFLDRLDKDTDALRDAGLFKAERIITSPQRADIAVGDGSEPIAALRRSTRRRTRASAPRKPLTECCAL